MKLNHTGIGILMLVVSALCYADTPATISPNGEQTEIVNNSGTLALTAQGGNGSTKPPKPLPTEGCDWEPDGVEYEWNYTGSITGTPASGGTGSSLLVPLLTSGSISINVTTLQKWKSTPNPYVSATTTLPVSTTVIIVVQKPTTAVQIGSPVASTSTQNGVQLVGQTWTYEVRDQANKAVKKGGLQVSETLKRQHTDSCDTVLLANGQTVSKTIAGDIETWSNLVNFTTTSTNGQFADPIQTSALSYAIAFEAHLAVQYPGSTIPVGGIIFVELKTWDHIYYVQTLDGVIHNLQTKFPKSIRIKMQKNAQGQWEQVQ